MKSISKPFSLILAAEKIPSETQVTKRTGTKPYTLARRIRMFIRVEGAKNADTKELLPTPGSVYLLSDEQDACIEQLPGSTQLAVHFDTLEELHDFLQELFDEEEHGD